MVPRPRLAVTLGDPAGIGPEIVLKALARPEVLALAQFVVFGYVGVVGGTARRLGRELTMAQDPSPGTSPEPPADWQLLPFYENLAGVIDGGLAPLPDDGSPSRPALVQFDDRELIDIRPGQWTRLTGAASLAWVRYAARAALPGAGGRRPEVEAVVTAPICKAAWQDAGARWPGHTELLADLCREATGGAHREVMLLAGGGLRVALATVHEPVARVPGLLTVERIVEVGQVLHRGLVRDFGLERPRLAVLGLNPHAGEDGHLGTEDRRIVAPAVEQLRRAGLDATGPHPADTTFHFARQGRYDAILAMYHDQGLGPLKTVAFDEGVNITLGLPLARTSPDHGTAFDIAGSGRASEASLVAAIRAAVDIAQHRRRSRA